MAMMLRGLLTILLAVLLQANAWSQGGADKVDSRDFPGISRFPGSHIVDYRSSADTQYSLALGRLQRANGRVTAGREERIQGILTRITYAIPSGYSGADVFEGLSTQLLAGEGAELFRCQGRSCGSSNFWANDIFANRILYGPETDQFYLASTSAAASAEASIYTALYVITRGNRSVYAHLDILELPGDSSKQLMAATPAALLEGLHQDGSVILPGLTFDERDQLLNAEGIELLIDTLQANPQMRVYVVAHLRAPAELEALLERSRYRAALIVSRLAAAGIAAERLSAQGLGPLAPACSGSSCAERIELVLQ